MQKNVVGWIRQTIEKVNRADTQGKFQSLRRESLLYCTVLYTTLHHTVQCNNTIKSECIESETS